MLKVEEVEKGISELESDLITILTNHNGYALTPTEVYNELYDMYQGDAPCAIGTIYKKLRDLALCHGWFKNIYVYRVHRNNRSYYYYKKEEE